MRARRSASCSASKARCLAACSAAISPPAGSLKLPRRDIVVIASASVRRPAATAPSIAAPSSTGSLVSVAATRLPVASATICLTSPLFAAPPLATSASKTKPLSLEQADHLRQALRQSAQAGDIERHRALRIVAEVEADDRAARRRIGVRRTIAKEIGQYVQIAGQLRRLRGAAGASDDVALQRIEGVRPAGGVGEGRVIRIRRSIAAPNADWPPSTSHWPGVSAE